MAAENFHSMPTPPFSPQNMRILHAGEQDALKSTANVVDSLVAYYQHEKMWVYRTRAALEDAFSPATDGEVQYHQQQSYAREGRPYGLPTPIEREGLFQGLDSGPGDQGDMSPSRWKARKRGFKLKLEGIRAKRVINTQSPDQLHPREQILEMYEKMMEGRMQSCQRVSKMIQDANRAKLHDR
ncbi:hypothetical protein CPB83DRAFT_843839 [Crepidotus variabilis]|uniref:Uncharacterized protein n=1 Tax=Crepidotus variabilis TaxID=179855 RepID=A0A9P6EQH2_9AGAR|nr:hypothetical protein CPB83DRAFT_843839 [Crepidotus variabilis]